MLSLQIAEVDSAADCKSRMSLALARLDYQNHKCLSSLETDDGWAVTGDRSVPASFSAKKGTRMLFATRLQPTIGIVIFIEGWCGMMLSV